MRWISWWRDLVPLPSSANHPRRDKRRKAAEAFAALKRSLTLEHLELRALLAVVSLSTPDDVAYEAPSVNSAAIRVSRDGSLTNSLAVTVVAHPKMLTPSWLEMPGAMPSS